MVEHGHLLAAQGLDDQAVVVRVVHRVAARCWLFNLQRRGVTHGRLAAKKAKEEEEEEEEEERRTKKQKKKEGKTKSKGNRKRQVMMRKKR